MTIKIIDGVEFSEDTIKYALIKAGHKFDKPKFEPINIHAGCFIVDVDGDQVLVKVGETYPSSIGCHQSFMTVSNFIIALQKAREHIS